MLSTDAGTLTEQLWADLTRELETLASLDLPGATSPAELAPLHAALTALGSALADSSRLHCAEASLYDMLLRLLAPRPDAEHPALLPCVARDLAARVSYAYRYPDMVQYSMLCDATGDESDHWVHAGVELGDPALIATQLSFTTLVAAHRELTPQQWFGYRLTDADLPTIRLLAANFPLLEFPPSWFGDDPASCRWAVHAAGLLDLLAPAECELALGLLDGWAGTLDELLAAARRLAA